MSCLVFLCLSFFVLVSELKSGLLTSLFGGIKLRPFFKLFSFLAGLQILHIWVQTKYFLFCQMIGIDIKTHLLKAAVLTVVRQFIHVSFCSTWSNFPSVRQKEKKSYLKNTFMKSLSAEGCKTQMVKCCENKKYSLMR